MDTKTSDSLDHDQQLTLVDIEELRAALGAEAELTTTTAAAAEPVSTVMCPQWY